MQHTQASILEASGRGFKTWIVAGPMSHNWVNSGNHAQKAARSLPGFAKESRPFAVRPIAG